MKYAKHGAVLVVGLLAISGCGLFMDNEARLDRGQAALDEGNYRAAIIDAKEVLRQEPNNVRGRLLLGLASVRAGDGASAEKELLRAIELDTPKSDVFSELVSAYYLQQKFQFVVDELDANEALVSGDNVEERVRLLQMHGDSLLGLSRPEDAREKYTIILAEDAANVAAQLGVYSTYLAERNIPQAQATIDHLKTEFPEHVEVRLASAELAYRLGNDDLAVDEFKKALELATAQELVTGGIAALGRLAELALRNSNTDEAADYVAELKSIAPSSPDTLLLEARLAAAGRDWETAQLLLQTILQSVPEHRGVQTMLGAVHLESGNTAQAEMYLSAVVAAAPENVEARRLLAETQIRLNKLREAEEALRPLVGSEEVDAQTASLAARLNLSRGEGEEAIRFLTDASNANPGNVDLKFQLAMALMRTGRLDETQVVLDSVDTEASEDAEYRRDVIAAMALLLQRRDDEAVIAIRAIAENWPDLTGGHNLLGAVEFAEDRLELARASFERAEEIDPDDIVTQRYLAILDDLEGNTAGSRQRFERIHELQPGTVWVMYGLAQLAAKDNDLDVARQWLQEMAGQAGGEFVGYSTLARIELSIKDYQAARSAAVSAIEIYDADPRVHNILGTANLRLGETDVAVSNFRRAVSLDSNSAEYKVNLARALNENGDLAGAIAAISDDGESYMTHLPSAVTLALMKAEAGDIGFAIDTAVKLQQRYPNSPIPHSLMGEIHIKKGELPLAEAAYNDALAMEVTRGSSLRQHFITSELERSYAAEPLEIYLEIRPDDGEVRMLLAQYLDQRGNTDSAIDEYQKVVATDESNYVALNNLAWIYQSNNDARAEATARRAVELAPGNASVMDTLGWILLQSGNVDESVRLLRQASELADGNPNIGYHLAAALVQSDQIEEARQTLQAILDAGGDFVSRRDAENLLKGL